MVPVTVARVPAAAYAMKEQELERHIRRMCGDLGLAVNHFADSRRSWLPGFPDLEIFGTRILHRELKSQHGRLTVDQRWVGSRIGRSGGDWAVWRPADLLGGVIFRQLAAIAEPRRFS